LEEQAAAETGYDSGEIRAKYKSLQSAQRTKDPIRKYLSSEIEKELKGLRDSLSHDEIIQSKLELTGYGQIAGPIRPSVVDPSNPTLFAEVQDEYHFLQRLLD
jgi:hypothetical protein